MLSDGKFGLCILAWSLWIWKHGTFVTECIKRRTRVYFCNAMDVFMW